MPKVFNASIKNLEYRLRAFRDNIPGMLESIIKSKEDVIVSAIADDQLYRRGINGKGEKIMSYAPYRPRTIANKRRKGQPTTRVTLRDTGAFHKAMFVAFEPDGFYVSSADRKTEVLTQKYGETIFRLTNKNLTRIIGRHIRKEFVKRLKRAIKE